ncbi:MAG TPA: hypothetical protein VKV26_21000 [Dehalococcoidia bacterium]|nr:hypothetical protein [Dehalococcoidia bacterium]
MASSLRGLQKVGELSLLWIALAFGPGLLLLIALPPASPTLDIHYSAVQYAAAIVATLPAFAASVALGVLLFRRRQGSGWPLVAGLLVLVVDARSVPLLWVAFRAAS